MNHKLQRVAQIVIPLYLLGFFFVVCTFTMGISLGDDSWYLQDATNLHASTFLYFQYWEPLYSLWFKLLTLVCHDPIWRYFLSWGILAILLAIIPLLLKIQSAWIYSFLVVSFPLLTVDPFVALFGSVIVLFSMCLILRRPRPLSEIMTAACLTCFVVGFCRSEYDYGVFVAAAATFVAVLWETFVDAKPDAWHPTPSRSRRIAMLLAASLATSIILVTMAHSSVQRSGEAFAQHYNIRAADAGLIPPSPDNWKSNYAEKAFGIDLNGNAAVGHATMGDFFRANPRLFVGHIWRNLKDYRTLVLLLVILAIYLWTWIREDACTLRHASLFLLLVILPPLAGILTIYPRNHYALLIVPSLLIFTLQLVTPAREMNLSLKGAIRLVAAGMALIWLFNWSIPHRRMGLVSIERRDLKRVQCVRSVDESASLKTSFVFDAAAIRSIYFAHPRTVESSAMLSRWEQFESWAASTRPAWISIDKSVAQQYNVTPGVIDTFLVHELGYLPQSCAADAQMTVYRNPER